MEYKQQYKNALEKARELLSCCIDDRDRRTKIYRVEDIESIFPELKESEDERIRKELIEQVAFIPPSQDELNSELDTLPCYNERIERYRSWLEKQGEQTWKPTAAQLIVIKDLMEDKNTSRVNKVILRGMFDEFKQFTNSHKREIDDAYLQGICDAKHEIEKHSKQTHVELGHSEVSKTSDRELIPKFNFKVGQWIVATGKRVYLITKIDGFNVTLVDTNGDEYVFHVSSLVDAYQWTIADAKDGDVLVDENDNIGLYSGEKDDLYWHSCVYLGCDGFIHGGFGVKGYHKHNNTKPATEEQRDLLFSKMEQERWVINTDKKI